MRNSHKIIPFLITFILALTSSALAGQFKITRVYDGDTVKAQGHDIETRSWRKVVKQRGMKQKIWKPRVKSYAFEDFK